MKVERAKLNELIVANKALHAPIDDDVSQLIGDAATAGLKVTHSLELIHRLTRTYHRNDGLHYRSAKENMTLAS